MKKITLFTTILLLIGVVTNAQIINTDKSLTAAGIPINKVNMNDNSDSALTREYYLKKSRNNTIASFCFLGGGAIIIGIGASMFPKNYDPIWETDTNKDSQADVATTVMVIGIAAMLGSIPFTVMSGVNKRKAKLAVSSQKTGFGVPPNVSKDITGISISFPLGK